MITVSKNNHQAAYYENRKTMNRKELIMLNLSLRVDPISVDFQIHQQWQKYSDLFPQ